MALNEYALFDAVFLALSHPAAAPVLQTELRMDWESKTLPMPERFLVPLASPEGTAIGFVEFRFVTASGSKARFAATALHSVRDAERLSLPRLRALSPLPQAAP